MKLVLQLPTSSQTDILLLLELITTGAPSYRFGQPVTITLNDPDLNLKNDIGETFRHQ